jgi:DNA replication protein DnaC
VSGLQKAEGLLGSVAASLQRIEGSCGEHGAATVLARADRGWYCPACLEAAKRDEGVRQWAQDRAPTLHGIAGIPPRYRGQKFNAVTPAQKQVRAMAAAFRDFVVAEPRWACLLLIGDLGTGKTQLACELGESFINRLLRSVRYVTAKGMVGEIQAAYSTDGKTEESEIERFVRYDLLILDEIDLVPPKENALSLLTEVVNRRYGGHRPMIVITNQQLADLGKFVGDRVVDRFHENGFPCAFDWPSFRRAS